MPKRRGNLWPEVVSWQNLLLAYQRCRRRKRFKPDAVRFEFDWESNLIAIQRRLISGAYRPGRYRHFWVREPKRRKISAAPFADRVVHHAVVNVLEPVFEPGFVEDSYACRRGKGTHRAVTRAQQFARRYAYYLKTDVVKFFPNVDHAVLLERLRRRIKDAELLGLVQTIVASGEGILREEASQTFFPGDDLFARLRPTGLPIGNLTSQFFANVLLDALDHYVKERLRIPGYVRYADDLVLFADSKSQLREAESALARTGARRGVFQPHCPDGWPLTDSMTSASSLSVSGAVSISRVSPWNGLPSSRAFMVRQGAVTPPPVVSKSEPRFPDLVACISGGRMYSKARPTGKVDRPRRG